VPAIGCPRVTTGPLEGRTDGFEAAASCLPRRLVELPLRTWCLDRLEELELSFHTQEYPRGV